MYFNTQFELFKREIEDILLMNFSNIEFDIRDYDRNNNDLGSTIFKNKKFKTIFSKDILNKLVLANNTKLIIESTIIHNTNIKLGKTSSKKFIEITFKFIPSEFSSYKVFLSFKLPINIITVGQKPFFSDNKKKRLYNSLITHFKPLVSDNNFLIKGTLTQYET